jgi:hypothetical protein
LGHHPNHQENFEGDLRKMEEENCRNETTSYILYFLVCFGQKEKGKDSDGTSNEKILQK